MHSTVTVFGGNLGTQDLPYSLLDVFHSGRLIRVLLFQKSLNIIVLVLWQSSFPFDMGHSSVTQALSGSRLYVDKP